MKHYVSIILLVVLFPTLLFAQEKDSIRVFYLGGQSNMIGFGMMLMVRFGIMVSWCSMLKKNSLEQLQMPQL